ncbi:MAG: hypothetical protein Aureis2KO_00290 [Aureisphaera sp.]
MAHNIPPYDRKSIGVDFMKYIRLSPQKAKDIRIFFMHILECLEMGRLKLGENYLATKQYV